MTTDSYIDAHSAQQEPLALERMRNVPQVINATFDLLRLYFRPLATALLKFAAPWFLLGSGIVAYGLADIISLAQFGSPAGFAAMLDLFLIVGLSLIPVYVGTIFMTAIVHGAIALYREREREDGTDVPMVIDAQAIWQRSRPWIGRSAGSLIIFGIALFVLNVASAFIPFVGVFLFYGLVAFVSLYFPLRFYDERGLLQGFIVSTQLVTGRWAATFGLLALLYILSILLGGLFLMPVIVGGLLSGFGVLDIEALLVEQGFWYYLMVVGVTLYFTTFYLLVAIPQIALVFQYFAQTERKEGRRLRRKIDRLFPALDRTPVVSDASVVPGHSAGYTGGDG